MYVGQYAHKRGWSARPIHQGHRGKYNGNIDGAIDDFLVVLKGHARRLLRECTEDTPALREFHLDFF